VEGIEEEDLHKNRAFSNRIEQNRMEEEILWLRTLMDSMHVELSG
jgi:hypothetical protein